MLELAKKIIIEVSVATTKIDLTNFGLYDEDIPVLKKMLEEKPHITQIILTRNYLTEDSAAELAAISSLTHISVGQNNFGNEGATMLLAKKNLKFLDLTGNSLDREVASLIEKRMQDGVTIVTYDNPDLYPEDPSFKEDPILSISTVLFRTNEPTVPTRQRTSGDVVEEAFFDRRRKSPEPVDPELEISLMDQFKAYLTQYPERSDKLLSELNNFCSSIKFVK